jgi:hypothetical protein
MLKRVAFGLAGLTAMIVPSLASTPISNPWAGDGAETLLNIQVGTIGEVWSALRTDQARNGVPRQNLIITNAGGFIPAGGKLADTIYHFANVDYEVSVDIANGTIPLWSRFHVIIGITNFAAFNSVFAGGVGHVNPVATEVVTWRRDAGPGYDLSGEQPGTPEVVYSGTYSASAVPTAVAYAADAIHGLPPVNLPGAPIDVIWTIASVP